MKNICIFYQAPAELPYIIQLYNEYKGRAKITIIVVNVYSNYEFIKSLSLSQVTIYFCDWPCRNKKLLHAMMPAKKILYKFWKTYLASIEEGEVFFFSASFDWVTAYFIRKFCTYKKIKVHYAGFNTTELLLKEAYEEKKMNKGLSMKDYLRLFCFFIITGIWFDYLKKLSCVSFPYFKYNIQHKLIKLNTETISSYKYCIPIKKNNIILLFTTTWDYEDKTVMNHVDNKVCEIIKHIRKEGFQVVAKGHPRLGLSKTIADSVDLVLPNYIPAEFISEKCVTMILGINSAAMIYYAKYSDLKVVSLLNMLEGTNKHIIDENITLLNKMCDSKINFPTSMEQLKTLLKKA